jgi:hypothetical protein
MPSPVTLALTYTPPAPGGVLPAAFWRANEANVRGGVEWAFLSTTKDYAVALRYTAAAHFRNLVEPEPEPEPEP